MPEKSSLPTWWLDPWFRGALLLPLPVWGCLSLMGTKPSAAWWMLLFFAPVIEELVFRGALQTLLLQSRVGKRRCGAVSGANALTALAFGLAHVLVNGHPWGMLTFFPGLVFGFFRERYQGVPPAIVLHAYYNAGLLLL
jgi:membrane protease YdiL (CAAX protease family)